MKRNKLTALSLFVMLTVMIQKFSTAQIVYKDVNPDVISSSTYNLDLNNDGTVDFVINHTAGKKVNSNKCTGTKTNDAITVTPSAGCSVLNSADNTGKSFPAKTPFNSIINNQQNWNSNKSQVMISYNWACEVNNGWGGEYYFWNAHLTGQWTPYFPMDDGCLGLKLSSGGHFYYGWIRLNTSDGTTFTVKEYAFNSIPDKQILAGQSSDNYLSIGTISAPGEVCTATNIAVPYIITGTFSPSNEITAQLSDANGSFSNPVAIGNVTSNVSGNINAVIPALTPSGNAYRIRVTASNPVRTSYPNSFDLAVTGGELPSGDIAAGAYSSTNICDGNVFLVSYAYPETCNSYQWKLNGKDISGATSRTYDPTAAGDYTCIVTNGAGRVTSNVVTVTANAAPATIQVSYPGPTVCGEAIYLTNTGMSGAYQWKQNGKDIPDATESSYYPAVSGNYSCMVTNACGSLNSNTISVSINPPMADAVITASGPTVICNGTVALNANTGPGLSYQWYDVSAPYSTYNPRIIPGATSSSYAASVTGVYIVTETNSAGCNRTSNYIVALVGNPHPTIYPSSLTLCQGSPVNLYVEPSDYVTPPNSYSYQWIKDGVNISNATAQNYTAKKPGTYSVKATLNSGGCSGTSEGVIITNGCNKATTAARSPIGNNSESSILNELKLNVAPNPASSMVNITFSLPESGKVALALYNINGQPIKTITQGNLAKGIHDLTLDTKDLGAGIYILYMQSQRSVQTRKLILVK